MEFSTLYVKQYSQVCESIFSRSYVIKDVDFCLRSSQAGEKKLDSLTSSPVNTSINIGKTKFLLTQTKYLTKKYLKNTNT